MAQKLPVAVIVDEFQPPTSEQLKKIKGIVSLINKKYSRIVLLMIQHPGACDIKHPLTWGSRISLIRELFKTDFLDLTVLQLKDSIYNSDELRSRVEKALSREHLKSHFFYWDPRLEWVLPEERSEKWGHFDQDWLWKKRSALFLKGAAAKKVFPKVALRWFENNYWGSPQHKEHLREYKSITKYRKSWGRAPYPPVFSTVDAVLICRKKVLLIRRGHDPGTGLIALPGGYIEQNEFVSEGAIRELIEETSIQATHNELRQSISARYLFDHPDRSSLGRVISSGFLFELKRTKLPLVKAADDAAQVFWWDLNRLSELEPEFFEDHFLVIEQLRRLKRIQGQN